MWKSMWSRFSVFILPTGTGKELLEDQKNISNRREVSINVTEPSLNDEKYSTKNQIISVSCKCHYGRSTYLNTSLQMNGTLRVRERLICTSFCSYKFTQKIIKTNFVSLMQFSVLVKSHLIWKHEIVAREKGACQKKYFE